MARSAWKRLVRSAVGAAAASIDVAAVRLVQRLGSKGGPPDLRRSRERLEQAVRDAAALDLERLFAAPPAIDPKRRELRPAETRLGRSGAGEPRAIDLSWPSTFEAQGPARERLLAVAENRIARARVFFHPEPRPALILVHGYGGGAFAFEERALAVRLFFQRSFDVALFQLPFHGERLPADGSAPRFPTRDLQRTVQAFAQAVHDLRALAGWLRARGSSEVGLSGMSLGGYTVALAATAERFDFLVPIIPLADVAAVQLEHEALREVQVPAEHLALARQALSPISPLARTPLVAREDVLVIAARHDRITDPGTHAARLAAHFGARLDWFEGGHLLQLGRTRAFADAASFMAERSG
jgi:pimeloyl-ACP methyl ester carboxylesterase